MNFRLTPRAARLHRDLRKKIEAQVIEPYCGACINAGPGVSTRPDQVVISAQNRNFPGRSGPGQMYLASPLTVAASTVAGYIVEYHVDPVSRLSPSQYRSRSTYPDRLLETESRGLVTCGTIRCCTSARR